MIGLIVRKWTGWRGWIVFSPASMVCCALSLCTVIFYHEHLVNIADWSALMDTAAGFSYAAKGLVIGTIAINALAAAVFLRHRTNE